MPINAITRRTFVAATAATSLAACLGAPASIISRASSPFTDGHVRAADGRLIYYSVGGSGAPLVLLHSAFTHSGLWDGNLPALAPGRRLVRIDAPNHGRSSPAPSPLIAAYDIGLVLDHLRIERASFVGSSLGGASAIDFALLHPDRVESVALAGSLPAGYPPHPEDRERIMEVFRAAEREGLEAAIQRWVDHPMNASSSHAVKERLRELARGSAAIFTIEQWPFRNVEPPAAQRLSELRIPILLLIGRSDTSSLTDRATEVASSLPNGRLEWFEKSGHFPNLDEPRRFEKSILRFLGPTGGQP